MNRRIPPDRAIPAILLTDGPESTRQATRAGWTIGTLIEPGRGNTLAQAMTGHACALIWTDADWAIILPVDPAIPRERTATAGDNTDTASFSAVTAMPDEPDADTIRMPVIGLADPDGHRRATRADLLDKWHRITQAAAKRKHDAAVNHQ